MFISGRQQDMIVLQNGKKVFPEEIETLVNKIDLVKDKSKLLEDINKLKDVLENRFGKITEEMIIYMHEEWFEKLAAKIGIDKINQTKNFIEIVLIDFITCPH